MKIQEVLMEILLTKKFKLESCIQNAIRKKLKSKMASNWSPSKKEMKKKKMSANRKKWSKI